MELYRSAQELPAGLSAEILEPTHFLQTDFWASFKEAHGWKHFRIYGVYKPADYLSSFAGTAVACFTCSILTRSFSLPVVGNVSLAYIPMGVELSQTPEIMAESVAYGKFLSDFSYSLRNFLDKKTL